MKILTFTYTKSDGSQSARVVLPLTSPSKNYFGIDLSELDYEEQASFALGYELLQDEFNQKVHALMKDFDLSKNYRNFLEAQITDLDIDEL
jgi:hypothetical protein